MFRILSCNNLWKSVLQTLMGPCRWFSDIKGLVTQNICSTIANILDYNEINCKHVGFLYAIINFTV
jgi:hypothetical protein